MASTFTIRTYQRFPVHCRVHYRGVEGPGQGMVWNLSRTGWRIDGNRSVIPGDHLTLVVYLPNKKRLTLVDRAVVRWSGGKEFGLENVQVGADNDARLGRFVMRLVQEPQYRPS